MNHRLRPVALRHLCHLAIVLLALVTNIAFAADPTLTQQTYLKSSNPELFGQFGGDVAMSGDTLVVGAQGEDSPGADNAGPAYVFSLSFAPALGSVITAGFTPAGFRFTLPVAPGQTVGVQYSATLDAGLGLDLGNVTVADGIGFFTDTDMDRTGRSIGYYRPFLR